MTSPWLDRFNLLARMLKIYSQLGYKDLVREKQKEMVKMMQEKGKKE